jgi:hypothetical protein
VCRLEYWSDGEKNGVLEYWRIGVLGFKCITPLLHYSSTPVCQLMSHGSQLEITRNFRDPVTTTLLQSWTFEPWIIIPLLLANTIYLRGWWQLHRRLPRRFSVWRLVAFQAGLLTLFLALASPLHALAEQLLQFHMIQHLLLMMVVPPLFGSVRRLCRYCTDCHDPCCGTRSARSSPLQRSNIWAAFSPIRSYAWSRSQ